MEAELSRTKKLTLTLTKKVADGKLSHSPKLVNSTTFGCHEQCMQPCSLQHVSLSLRDLGFRLYRLVPLQVLYFWPWWFMTHEFPSPKQVVGSDCSLGRYARRLPWTPPLPALFRAQKKCRTRNLSLIHLSFIYTKFLSVETFRLPDTCSFCRLWCLL